MNSNICKSYFTEHVLGLITKIPTVEICVESEQDFSNMYIYGTSSTETCMFQHIQFNRHFLPWNWHKALMVDKWTSQNILASEPEKQKWLQTLPYSFDNQAGY
jgi:hypothetical protein